jgi:RimJ/RimL family protein N-acetyltransferase
MLAAMGAVLHTGPLRGHHVELVPLERSFADELALAASGDRSSFRWTEVPNGLAATARYIDNLLAQRDRGESVPFAQRHLASGRLVGCTRFMDLRRWFGRAEPEEVEIGGTWLNAEVQRTPINTEGKLLLLTHAFEVWRVRRVALSTDERNERSRRAIERIGASFEGVLRHHRPSKVEGEQGQLRNSAMFAVLDDEWPAVAAQLRARLAHPSE